MVKQNNSNPPTALTVYRASAGSGKTFRLAVEYIKHVVSDPLSYSQILAVTFTNKATEEMKLRILSQLYGIAHRLPSSAAYMSRITDELKVDEAYVSTQAATALHNLLHNYSGFHVETIDTFFQRILRNLARELDLTANLRVGLNDNQVEELAVDRIVDELRNNDTVLQWILKYIMESIDDDHSWNVIGQIKSFGKTIFKDFYKAASADLHSVLGQKNFLQDYMQQMRELRAKSLKRAQEIGSLFFEKLGSTPSAFTINDLAYKESGVGGLFLKLQNGKFDETVITQRVIGCQENAAKWLSKTHPHHEELLCLVETTLQPMLNDVLREREKLWSDYKSADLTLRHLYKVSLLEVIEQKVHELNQEQNRFLLSDTQQLLNDLIDGSDAPFIYEKTGSRLKHIMIDEFQDTSVVQWKNFKVLLNDAMSNISSRNLIVGDVKQSIYRWRNGDWRLLHNITDEFKHAEELIDIETLSTNYRSCRRVVEFNNLFFQTAAAAEGVEAYSDVAQKVPDEKKDEGMVSIMLLPKEDYYAETLNQTLLAVTTLLEGGARERDIAILVRANKHMPAIAEHFKANAPHLTIVSDEAFRLNASVAVNTIIQAIELLVHPTNLIAEAYLRQFFSGSEHGPMPTDFEQQKEQLLRMPLLEMTLAIYKMFELDRLKGEDAYMMTFIDVLNKYITDEGSDPEAFLKEWNSDLNATTIQANEPNGIRLLSIHKSKGLEFPHVIVPFCDWQLELPDTIWCSTTAYPFCQLPLVPINFSAKMKGTVYESKYEEEHRQNIIDNLNLLYVAFTRAGRSLTVIGKRGSKGSRSLLIEQCLPALAEQLNVSIEGQESDELPICLTYGTLSAEQKSSSSSGETDNILLRQPLPEKVTMQIEDSRAVFRQSNDSRLFTGGEEMLPPNDGYIQLGKVLHRIFSTIRSTDDLPLALRSLEAEGVLPDSNFDSNKIRQLITKRLSDPRVALWFEPGRWQVFNECTICWEDTANRHLHERRPDRVITDGKRTIVIDFKFGKQQPDHIDQVSEYMSLLNEMGYDKTEGFLWYVYSNKIIEVK